MSGAGLGESQTLLAADAPPLLALHEISLTRSGAERPLLDKFSLTLGAGDAVVLLGEADCGKDALLALLAGRIERSESASGSIRFSGSPVALSARRIAPLPRTVYLPGPHSAPLSPHASTLEQLTHILARRLGTPRASARSELSIALGRLPGAPGLEALDALPHRLAPELIAWGLFALSFAQTPALILADQPLAGIAPLPLRALAGALQAERKRLGFALLYSALSTEMAPALGGRTIILRHGRIVEEGPIERLTSANAHNYTRTLLRNWTQTDAAPRSSGRGEPVLQVFGLPVPAAESQGAVAETLNFELRRGAALGFVGERGSGRHRLLKQITARMRPRAGRVLFDAVDTGILAPQMLMRLRRRIAYIAGDDDALDPRMDIADTVSEPLRAHLRLPRDIIAGYREAALKRVGLASLPGATPVAELSRFDKRRLQVARAIVTAPLLCVIDEPLLGLDAFAQSVMRDLLRNFRTEEGPALIVVTADFAIARALAETAFIFADGRVAERGPVAEMLRNPKDAVTRRLIAAADAARGLGADGLS